MSKRNQRLRALVTERLTAAAEEIFALVERTIAEYEEELCRSKEENQRRQQLLEEALGSQQQVPVHGAADDTEGREEEFTIKSEPEELSIQQEIAYTAVHVKNDTEESAVLHEGLTSVDNENTAEDWTKPWEPLASSEERDGASLNVIKISNSSATSDDTPTLSPGCSGADNKPSVAELMSKVRRNRCPICGKTFKRDLWSHMLVHTGERPFSCSVCQKGFTRKSSLSLHMKLHLSERPFRCTICQREFAQKSNFTIHMERHAKAELKHQQLDRKRMKKKMMELSAVSEEQSLESENLVQDFEQDFKQDLGQHFEQDFKQDFGQDSAQDLHRESSSLQNRGKRKCREMYEVAQSLRLSAKNRGPDRSEECPVCGKTFHDLWPHMRLHTGERPYRCSVCRKGFPRRSSLTLHKRLHMQEKPFKCPLCQKEFTQNNNFKRHMAKHEKEGDMLKTGKIAMSRLHLQHCFQMESDQMFDSQAASSVD